MYLYVNPVGYRHWIVEKFSDLDLAKLFKDGMMFKLSILDPVSPGKYDIILEYHQEKVSKERYFTGFIIKNPDNRDYFKQNAAMDGIFGLMSSLTRETETKYTGKRYPIAPLFPDNINNYVSVNFGKPRLLDDHKLLTEELDAFFAEWGNGGNGKEPVKKVPTEKPTGNPVRKEEEETKTNSTMVSD
jgi:hypothetical protein